VRGLKENVIIGRLIPVGTGFNVESGKTFEVEPAEDAVSPATAAEQVDETPANA
jgi:hypothetical protein